jgi:hypothetical protein
MKLIRLRDVKRLLSATNQVAKQRLLVTLENCRIDLPTWFGEFIRVARTGWPLAAITAATW